MPLVFQSVTDRADPPIHHVGRSDDVRSRFRLVERLADQHFDRGIVENVAGIVQQPVLPVRGIGIECDIGQHAHRIPAGIPDRTDSAAHEIVGLERFGAIIAALVGRRVGKQRKARDPERHRFARTLRNQIHAPAGNAGQGTDRFLHIAAFSDKERPDQVRRRQHRFAMQRAAPCGGASAAKAKCRIGSRHAPLPAGKHAKQQSSVAAPLASAGLAGSIGSIDFPRGYFRLAMDRRERSERSTRFDPQ